jgi:hypothetical protein
MAGKRKAEDKPEVFDSDDNIMSDQEFEAMTVMPRARINKEYSEMFARLGLQQDACLRYSDDDDDDSSDEDDE